MDLPPDTTDAVDRTGPRPLTVHLIAESIFSHLDSIQDLLSCRKVSWTWRQMVIPMIHSRSYELGRITFSGSEAEAENSDNPDAASSPLTKLQNYLNYLEESKMEPRLSFSYFRFYNLLLEQPIVQQFLNQFGHTIRKLDLNASEELDYREFDNPEIGGGYTERTRHEGSVASLWRLLGTQCTQLEDLKFGQVNFIPTNEDTFPPFSSKIKRLAFLTYDLNEQLRPMMSNLLRNCHLLERLILYFNDDTEEAFSLTLRESPHLSLLKELTLNGVEIIGRWRVNQAQSENILRNLRLRKLKILMLINEEVDELNWFLRSQNTSLETLVIGWWFSRHDHVVDIIQPARHIPSADVMERLRELRIKYDFDELPFVLQPIDFRRQFPCLNKLILGGYAPQSQMDSLFVTGIKPQLFLEALQLPWKISQEHLKRAAEIFPNVKKLRVEGLGESAMRQLFTQWPNLESLYLKGFEGHDSILAGLSPRLLEAAEKIRVTFGREIDPYKVDPSIANFKHLKELRLDNIYLFAQPLTDLSLRYAISKLKKLEFLAVRGEKFSENGIKDLLNSIPQLQLCKDENKRWWKVGLQLQNDLSKKYCVGPIINEEFGSF